MKSGKPQDLSPRKLSPNLSKEATELYRDLVLSRPDGHISPGRLVGLQLAVEILDDYRNLRNIVELEGMTLTSKRSGLRRRHPLLDTYLRTRKDLFNIWKAVGLFFEISIDGVIEF